ncbi:MAG: GIY-YIG nuclease family protein [Firmicutes bacterium]|jgi:putative endonuclease|nr:GIY-YIG nuclease family protein [Bacillota bacterium]
MIKHFVYILECSDATLYTGYTTEPERRVKEHNEGRGAKYTRGRRPVKLVYLEGFSDKSEAVKREKEIKKLPREKKLSLIQKN